MPERLTPELAVARLDSHVDGLLQGQGQLMNTVKSCLVSAQDITEITDPRSGDIYSITGLSNFAQLPWFNIRFFKVSYGWYVNVLLAEKDVTINQWAKTMLISWRGKRGKPSGNLYINSVDVKDISFDFDAQTVKTSFSNRPTATFDLLDPDWQGKLMAQQMKEKKPMSPVGVIYYGFEFTNLMLGMRFRDFPNPGDFNALLLPQRVAMKKK